MNRRRAILLRVVVLLVLGAIFNVAVAWGCAAWSPVRTRPIALIRESPVWWTDEFDELFVAGQRDIYGGELGGIGRGGFASAGPEMTWCTFDFGWPTHGLRYGLESGNGKRVFHALRFPPSLPRRGALPTLPDPANEFAPLLPTWPGFAINTIFYAAILWLLFIAPFALRRKRRIKRGLCLKCAYPVGTNERCTECGSTLSTA